MTEINTAWTAASEEMYKASQAGAGQPGAEPNGGSQPNAGGGSSENVTDAEFEEVK